MPTTEQLYRQWEVDFEFGRNLDRGSEHAAIGEYTPTGIPDVIRRQRENPKGKLVGHMVKGENGELKFVPLKK